MRIVEIEIDCLDRKDAELFGEDEASETASRCFIDLDRVTAVWEDPEGRVCISLGADEESYWTRCCTLDEFVRAWTRSAVAPPKLISYHRAA